MSERSRALIGTVVLAVLVVAGCGGEASTTTTAAPTTTAVPATTTMATTTLPGDLHPTLGVSWAALWPPETAIAEYQVEIMGGDLQTLPAHFEYGLDWQGGTWDRLVIGTVIPGQDGTALYFARPAPWVLRLWGVVSTSVTRDDTVEEYFAEPPDFDLASVGGQPEPIEEGLVVAFDDTVSPPAPASFQLEWQPTDIQVPAGTFNGAWELHIGLAGDFYGVAPGEDITAYSDLVLDPQQFILKWDPSPAGGVLELVTPWPTGG
jgi:hypothetical protein